MYYVHDNFNFLWMWLIRGHIYTLKFFNLICRDLEEISWKEWRQSQLQGSLRSSSQEQGNTSLLKSESLVDLATLGGKSQRVLQRYKGNSNLHLHFSVSEGRGRDREDVNLKSRNKLKYAIWVNFCALGRRPLYSKMAQFPLDFLSVSTGQD